MSWITNWLSYIKDNNRKLVDFVIPGSHDAGVWNEAIGDGDKKMMKKNRLAVCQNDTFFEQAKCGSRFFDCRVFVRKKTAKRRGDDLLRLGHFAMEGKGN